MRLNYRCDNQNSRRRAIPRARPLTRIHPLSPAPGLAVCTRTRRQQCGFSYRDDVASRAPEPARSRRATPGVIDIVVPAGNRIGGRQKLLLGRPSPPPLPLRPSEIAVEPLLPRGRTLLVRPAQFGLISGGSLGCQSGSASSVFVRYH